ncbi:Hypothetical protein P9211_13111 [Prochlorococcus marinus str. MIT 9211]|uniref:Uncharacterized protein n=1 Tax=Prochlorococcus marinus (strain MIT 9211) TaxID=93059 RepID=A9BBN0_PROM4|nr:Hypothetical protein P9211_13111 [Prochlorococcus marinus str. MIT 9211]
MPLKAHADVVVLLNIYRYERLFFPRSLVIEDLGLELRTHLTCIRDLLGGPKEYTNEQIFKANLCDRNLRWGG